MTLNLIVDNRSIPINQFTFSGGEEHVRIDDDMNYGEVQALPISIFARVKNSAEFLAALMLCDAAYLRYLRHSPNIKLILPYLPYARQDRMCNIGEASSLSLILRIMTDSIPIDELQTWDVHNEVAVIDQLGNYIEYSNVPAAAFAHYLPPEIQQNKNLVVVSPDKGAICRAAEFAAALHLPVCNADKRRNPENGEILGIELTSLFSGEEALIVDDICDGGRTFIELAKILREQGAKKVYMYVTHAICSKGFAVFDDLIDQVFTPNYMGSPLFLGNKLLTILQTGDIK
jgi:ribose-phosphate pyrophosphokinase